MGCIMTPMPNHLSTCLSLPLNHKTVWGACGDGKSGEEEKSSVETTPELVRKKVEVWRW